MNLVPAFTTAPRASRSRVFGRVMSVAPLLFLSATTYYENRFEFYDLLVKRGAMLLATLVALGAFFALALAVARRPAARRRPARGSSPSPPCR